ncbi:D-alanyl-D-alanine dipeptidase [Synergistales bacterium]|nr:D-alanyl-D-alanine dipeptidase [Synergistales bacterium]
MKTNVSVAGVLKQGAPDDFVYIDEYIEDCVIDAKYWGTDNFIGRPIDGYDRPLVILGKKAAEACVQAAKLLRRRGLIMKIFDGYRPQSAVDDMVQWLSDEKDIRRKPIHYPNINKKDLLETGYVTPKSAHSRGNAVDLTLVDEKTSQELDMGSIFDFMDQRSHIITRAITPAQKQNRTYLRDAMCSSGFAEYITEWWHFSLVREPHPDWYYNFPVR